MDHMEVVRTKLDGLRQEHRTLDETIAELEAAPRPDPLTIRRLKKQKLALKDRIARAEDELTPDIIA
ncbi:MAG: YdcH family protein [Paracoccaceae bacterium]